MAIVRPKAKDAEAFISGAADAEPKPKGVRRGKKQQISLTIAPVLLRKVDELAAELGQSRAAVINLAIHRAVEHGLEIEGLRKQT
ncbi:MAG: ribbon-helix-helix protein, CopG family [Methylacidiphilaceae bacterium]|nr:ribbon-helix-helix protein, CopG family [Candidatus Methylacidiphilaceae bacterium]